MNNRVFGGCRTRVVGRSAAGAACRGWNTVLDEVDWLKTGKLGARLDRVRASSEACQSFRLCRAAAQSQRLFRDPRVGMFGGKGVQQERIARSGHETFTLMALVPQRCYLTVNKKEKPQPANLRQEIDLSRNGVRNNWVPFLPQSQTRLTTACLVQRCPMLSGLRGTSTRHAFVIPPRP